MRELTPEQEAAVIWTDPVTGQKLVNAREFARPVWLLDVGKHSSAAQLAMFERYRLWKAEQGD